MMDLVISTNTQPNDMCTKFKIDDTFFYTVKNVKDFSFCEASFNAYNVKVFPTTNESQEVHYYFNIELAFHESFAHYCFESVVYLHFFKELKIMFPRVKLLMRKPKIFKHLFCNLFDIPTDDIAYNLDISANNFVIFPEPESCLNNKPINENWTQLLLRMMKQINQINTVDTSDHLNLILPRQTKENFWGNPRTIPVDLIISDSEGKNVSVVNTDTITDLKEQIKIIRNTKKVIVTDGSPFLVNGIFTQNTPFYIIDSVTRSQSEGYLKYAYILSCIQQVNNNTLNYFKDQTELLHFIKLDPDFWN